MTISLLFQFLAGGALLIGGAELLVRGASRLAIAAGISPLVVGLTIVAFGTSSPELAVTALDDRGVRIDVAAVAGWQNWAD
jgi:cation:H+ antiporter